MSVLQDMSDQPRRSRAGALLGALLVLLTTCVRERASAADCAAILERIVALELAEQGFVDPELARRKQAEFARRFGPELARCEGLTLPPGARACVAGANSAEDISHICLR